MSRHAVYPDQRGKNGSPPTRFSYAVPRYSRFPVRATSGGTPTVYTFGVHETLRLPEMYCEDVPRHHVQAIAILMHMMVERKGTGSALADGQRRPDQPTTAP